MTHAWRQHRELDAAFDRAAGEAGTDLLVASRNRLKDLRTMSYGKQSRVHLMTLSVRTSGKGNAYLAGWLGKASVVAFAGEPDKFGNETWDVYVAEREERPPRQEASQPRGASRSPRPASPPGEAPGGRSGHRRQSNGSRRDQAAREVAERYGMSTDPSDPIPF